MIKLSNVTKKYDNNIILDDVTYTFKNHGLVCLIGPSGCGKTTLLNLLAGFDTNYLGSISCNKNDLNDLDNQQLCEYRHQNIGFIFQNYHLLKGYSVLENVLLSSELSSNDNKENTAKAKAILAKLQLNDKINQKCENLSGGQKQRVAIARALINDPNILLCDEPTGALDRKNADDIMHLLKELSKNRLVIVITHDQKVLSYADEVIHLENKKIVSNTDINQIVETERLPKKRFKANSFKMAIKNFKIHKMRYCLISLLLSIGLISFLFSLSYKNVFQNAVNDFQIKNIAYNNGYIQTTSNDDLYNQLQNDDRIENVYYQTKIFEPQIMYQNTTITIDEKYPMPKALEAFSYGKMPSNNQNEIALSINLAKKLDDNFIDLLGKTITLNYQNQNYVLVVSGIYNAPYDDYYISSDLDKEIMQNSLNEIYSITYDVVNFDDIIDVTNQLINDGYDSKTVVNEVMALTQTFNQLNQLFKIISIFILIIAISLCSLLLVKLQNSRYHEVGLLSAVGYQTKEISNMFMIENILLSLCSSFMTLIIYWICILIANIVNFPFHLDAPQILSTIISSFIIVMLISNISSYKVLHTEPSIALRK